MPERKFNVEYWFNKCQGGQAVYILFCNKHLVLLTNTASDYREGKAGLVASASFSSWKRGVVVVTTHTKLNLRKWLVCCQGFQCFSDKSKHSLFRKLNYVSLGLAKCQCNFPLICKYCVGLNFLWMWSLCTFGYWAKLACIIIQGVC